MTHLTQKSIDDFIKQDKERSDRCWENRITVNTAKTMTFSRINDPETWAIPETIPLEA